MDEADAAEVLTYRASLVAAALSVSAAATMAVVPGALPLGVEEAPAWAFDAAAAGFFAAFGVSLSTIHIYMKVRVSDCPRLCLSASVPGDSRCVCVLPSPVPGASE